MSDLYCAVSSGENWFVRTLGQELGPLPLELLIQMAERGELLALDEVRVFNLPWTPVGSVGELAPALAGFQWRNLEEAPPVGFSSKCDGATGADSQKPTTTAQKTAETDFTAAGILRSNEWVAGNLIHTPLTAAHCIYQDDKKIWNEGRCEPKHRTERSRAVNSPSTFAQFVPASIAVMSVCLIAFLLAIPNLSHDKDVIDYQLIEDIWQQAQSLRNSESSQEDWDEFAKESQPVLLKLVESLQQSASSRSPARQNMLWAARDYLLPLLKHGPEASSSDAKLQEQLNAANNILTR